MPAANNAAGIWAISHGTITVEPTALIDPPKTPKRLPEFVEEVRMDRLFAELTWPEGFKGRTHRLVLELLYGTGINALLNDPGPIPLRSKRLERELSRVLCLYLGIAKATDLGPRPALSSKR